MKVAFWLWRAVSAAVLTEAAAQAPRLALELQSEHATLRAGDEIPITFVLTNVGTTNYAFTDRSYDRSGRLWDYRLRAEDDRGLPVPDPRTLFSRGQAYIGGGLGTPSELQPGLRVTKTIALNLWAVVTEPGVYMVRGSYTTDNGQSVESPALTLRVLPRTYEEMGRHIEELATQLQDASDCEARVQLIQRLMYTADRRAAKPLLELSAQDSNSAFWIREAFTYYLPR